MNDRLSCLPQLFIYLMSENRLRKELWAAFLLPLVGEELVTRTRGPNNSADHSAQEDGTSQNSGSLSKLRIVNTAFIYIYIYIHIYI